MDCEAKAKSIIHESLSVYDGFNEKRGEVIKGIAEALTAAYAAGVADERARVEKKTDLLKSYNVKLTGPEAAEEREACARVAEAYKSKEIVEVFAKMENAVAVSIARAIRNRSI